MGLLAAAPTLVTAVAACAITGAASVVFLTTGNSTIQLTADPAYRGRVTALWSLALVGSTPIGSPVIGALAQLTSPRWALALGAAACVAAVAIGHWPVASRSQPGPGGAEPVAAHSGLKLRRRLAGHWQLTGGDPGRSNERCMDRLGAAGRGAERCRPARHRATVALWTR